MRAVLGWWTATHKSNERCYTCVQELIASWLVLDDLPLSDVDALFSTRTNFVQVDPAVVNLLHSRRVLHSDCPPHTDSLRQRPMLFPDPRPCHARVEVLVFLESHPATLRTVSTNPKPRALTGRDTCC